ncbi:substrate-binding domain-containing protein [Bdellovibrio sp. SKB1291214]|uniref:substrate-binding domain-containing protein n=1 Tax=Bdellovibrio sp. SKB1291214 TaxID=1732569 RepID=UPI0022400BF6|nr:substrate-binding domain-containing protein [Bdellovibrio sp. SKB1291214]UYL08251.1 substrate-binding domain-containing protein [Bdellovibrio sp. SKB1291214]
MRFIFALCLLMLVSSVSFAKDWKVAVLYWSMKIEGQVAMRKGLEEQVQIYNKENKGKSSINLIPFVAGEGRKGIENQAAQMQQALKEKPDVIVIQPTDNSTLASSLQEANSLKIPVIAYDQYIVNGELTAFITSANYRAGQDNGEFTSQFKPDQRIRIAVFEYPAVSSTTERVDGFFDSLRAQNAKFKVVGVYQAVDPESGRLAVKKFLKDFPDKNSVDVVFTVNDGGGLEIVKELQAKKRTEIKHVTFDGDPASVDNIRAGRSTVIDSAQFCGELGRETARTLVKVISGRSVERKIRVPTFPITKKTLNDYPGWMGVPKPEAAKKADRARPTIVPREEFDRNQKRIIRIGTTPLCPYICEKSPGVWTGYLFEILGEVSRDLGVELRLENVVTTRLKQGLETRKLDYIIAPEYLVRYMDDVLVVGPQLGVNYTGALFAKDKKTPHIIDNQSLENQKIIYSDFGLQDGRIEAEFTGHKINKLSGSDVVERMFRIVAQKRMDVALGDYNVLRYYQVRDKGQFTLYPTSITGFSFLVLVGLKKNPQVNLLGDGLNDWFVQSRKNTHLQEILGRYNLTDWSILTRD